MWPEDMTEEELMQILAQNQLQGDPMAASMNDYGQGSGYLDLPKKPTQFSRQGDMHQIYRNMFGMTGIKMDELVPDLWNEPEAPEGQPYQSDALGLYEGNQALEAVNTLVQDGMPVEEAMATVWEKDIPGVPIDFETQEPDGEAFRSNVETYITEKAKQERDPYYQQAQEYDDFTRERSGLDFMPQLAEYDPMQHLVDTRMEKYRTDGPMGPFLPEGPRQAPEGRTSTPQGGARGIPDADLPAFGAPTYGFDPSRDWRNEMNNGPVPSERGLRGERGSSARKGNPRQNAGGSKSTAGQPKEVLNEEARWKRGMDQRENQQRLASYEAYKKKFGNVRVQSKQNENRARIIRFYNQLIKQGG